MIIRRVLEILNLKIDDFENILCASIHTVPSSSFHKTTQPKIAHILGWVIVVRAPSMIIHLDVKLSIINLL